MAIRNPTFNLKTGADSDLIVAREETGASNPKIGKIKIIPKLFFAIPIFLSYFCNSFRVCVLIE